MNNQPKTNLIQKVIDLVPVSLAFLLPLFFLPTTTEFFEFNKSFLLLTGSVMLFILWAVKILLTRKVEFARSSMDLPISLFLITIVLSTIFSLNKTSSVYGSYGRWFPSLFGYLSLVVFFYSVGSNVKDKMAVKNSLLAFVMSVTIANVIGLLSYNSLFIGSAEFFRTVTFNPIGSSITSVIFAAVCVVVSVAGAMYSGFVPKKILMILAACINLFYIGLLGLLPGWVALVAGLLSLMYFVGVEKIKKTKVFSMFFGVLVVAVVAAFTIPFTRNTLRNKNFPTEIILPLKESWIISSSVVQDYPLLATGPSTFGLNFTRYRPVSLNSQSTWNFRFDKPNNEILNVLGTVGILGILSFFFMGYRIVRLTKDSKAISEEYWVAKALSAGAISLISVYFVTYATVATSFVLFLFLSLLISTYTQAIASKSAEVVGISLTTIGSSVGSLSDLGVVKKEYFHYIIVVPMFSLCIYTAFLGYKNYASEFYMRKSVLAASQNDGAKTYDYQAKAITLNPGRDVYHIAYAQTNLALANSIASKENLSDNDKQAIQTLISQAIRTVRVVTEVVNPLSAYAWEVRGSVYRNIESVAEDAADWAAGSYNTAIQLDPTNPTLRLALGGIYFAKEDYLSAASQFKQAAILKQDYANARYNLAQALLKLKDYKNGLNELEIVKGLVPQDSDDQKMVEREITELKKLPELASITDNKPTIEQIEQNTKTVGTNKEIGNVAGSSTQEPLSPAGE